MKSVIHTQFDGLQTFKVDTFGLSVAEQGEANRILLAMGEDLIDLRFEFVEEGTYQPWPNTPPRPGSWFRLYLEHVDEDLEQGIVCICDECHDERGHDYEINGRVYWATHWESDMGRTIDDCFLCGREATGRYRYYRLDKFGESL